MADESARGAQPGQGDRDEPADCGLGRQAAGRREGVETVTGELVGRDIIPEIPRLCDLDQQISDEVGEVLLRSGDVLTSMQECRQFGAVVLAAVCDERVGLEHRFEPRACVPGSVPECGEMLEVGGDVALVPGDQDRFHVREVLVQRRAPDAGLLGDPRHRHRRQPVLGHQRPSRF